MTQAKTCTSCKETLPNAAFHRKGTRIQPKCKKCRKIEDRLRYLRKKEAEPASVDPLSDTLSTRSTYSSSFQGINIDDYSVWEESKGGPLTDEEKIEVKYNVNKLGNVLWGIVERDSASSAS